MLQTAGSPGLLIVGHPGPSTPPPPPRPAGQIWWGEWGLEDICGLWGPGGRYAAAGASERWGGDCTRPPGSWEQRPHQPVRGSFSALQLGGAHSQLWDPQMGDRREGKVRPTTSSQRRGSGSPGVCCQPAWGSVSLPSWGRLQAVTPGDKESSRRRAPHPPPAVSESCQGMCLPDGQPGSQGPEQLYGPPPAPLLAQSHHTCQAGPDWPELLL